MQKATKKVNVWFWRLVLALGLVGVVLSQAGPVAAGSLILPPLPPIQGEGYVWGG